MKGYVACKGDRWYAVIYEGLDPVTGRERRRWHAAGNDRANAEKLAARLAGERNGRNDEARSLTFGAYLLIAAGVPVKVVSERLGHANPAFTIDTYQHVLPGMQADAARVFERLVAPAPLPADNQPGEARLKRRKKTT
jgi:integrase